MIAAAIDIGTNTLLLTVGERLPDCTVRILRDEHSIARLGAGVDAAGNIGREAIGRAAEILRRYRNICDEADVNLVAAVGTSALRDAANRDEVCAELGSVIGTEIRIIDGETEAALSFSGSVECAESAIVLDIGGGSTEIIAGRGGTIEYRTSMNIGAVRLTERFFGSFPPAPEMVAAVSEAISEQLPVGIPAYPMTAVAGTPTTLAAIALELQVFSPEKVHNFHLTLETVRSLAEMLLRKPLPEILALPGVHPQRADILPAGALILKVAMEKFGYSHCTVSTRGLRFGVLEEMLNSS